jgi:uncharacterized protein
MSSTNQGPEYFAAEKKFLTALNLEDKIYWLEEMIRNFKKHKGSEKMLAELRKRLIKLKGKQEKGMKGGKGKKGIRKEGFQVALVGLTNSGKSCLLGKLSNAKPLISDKMYTTKEPELGTMDFNGVKAQVVDFPAVEGKEIDFSVINTADLLLIVVEDLGDIGEVEKYLKKTIGKRLVVLNKVDLLVEGEIRKVKARMKSRKIDGVVVSCLKGEGIDKLKEEIFDRMGVIRVYTKEPGKKMSDKPMVLKEGSTVGDVAEMIYKGFSGKVKEARLTGPSGKFSNQRVGLKHRLKDKDVLEFRD